MVFDTIIQRNVVARLQVLKASLTTTQQVKATNYLHLAQEVIKKNSK
jgi:hypothetical protein